MYVVCVNERLGETTAMSGSARGKSGKHTFFCCVACCNLCFWRQSSRETPGSERRGTERKPTVIVNGVGGAY